MLPTGDSYQLLTNISGLAAPPASQEICSRGALASKGVRNGHQTG
jgi:hypothetical protein